jgi:hypothetical protein
VKDTIRPAGPDEYLTTPLPVAPVSNDAWSALSVETSDLNDPRFAGARFEFHRGANVGIGGYDTVRGSRHPRRFMNFFFNKSSSREPSHKEKRGSAFALPRSSLLPSRV